MAHLLPKFAKVMFLHLSVILFTGGVSAPGWGACWDTPPPGQTATAADGRHPTVMHSCECNYSLERDPPHFNCQRSQSVHFKEM